MAETNPDAAPDAEAVNRGDRVELTDLDVISRYSLAVRSATADRRELISTLRADLAWLEGVRRSAAPRTTTSRSSTASRSTGTTRKAVKKTATRRSR
jgi:hypothetical protein